RPLRGLSVATVGLFLREAGRGRQPWTRICNPLRGCDPGLRTQNSGLRTQNSGLRTPNSLHPQLRSDAPCHLKVITKKRQNTRGPLLHFSIVPLRSLALEELNRVFE